MRVNIDRDPFLKALQRAKGIIEKRTTVPILSNVLLRCHGSESLSLSSTDLEVSLIETIGARQVEKVGATTVPAQMLFDIVSHLPPGASISMYTATEKEGRGSDAVLPLMVQSGKSVFRLNSLPAEDYAVIKQDPFPNLMRIKSCDLLGVIDKTRFAMSLEETRYSLSGIFFEIHQEGAGAFLRAVATDGHRLSKAEAPLLSFESSLDGSLPGGIIIPFKAVQEITKLLEDTDEVVSVSFCETGVSVAVGDMFLSSRLIDGVFPDYHHVIPEFHPHHFKAKTHIFKEALERVAVMASDKMSTIKVHLEANKLFFTAANPHLGTAYEEIEINYDGASLEMGFSARYLIEAVRHIRGEEVTVFFQDPSCAILMKDEKQDPRLDFVIMPMRV